MISSIGARLGSFWRESAATGDRLSISPSDVSRSDLSTWRLNPHIEDIARRLAGRELSHHL